MDGLAYSIKLSESAFAQLTRAKEIQLHSHSISTPTKSYSLHYAPTTSHLIHSNSYTPLQQSLTLHPLPKSSTTTKKRDYRFSTSEEEESEPEIASKVIRRQLETEYEATIEPYSTLNALLQLELQSVQDGKEGTMSLKEIGLLVERLRRLRARLEDLSDDLSKLSLS